MIVKQVAVMLMTTILIIGVAAASRADDASTTCNDTPPAGGTIFIDVTIPLSAAHIAVDRYERGDFGFGSRRSPWNVENSPDDAGRIAVQVRNGRIRLQGSVHRWKMPLAQTLHATTWETALSAEVRVWHLLLGTEGAYGEENSTSIQRLIFFPSTYRRTWYRVYPWVGGEVGGNDTSLAVRFGATMAWAEGRENIAFPPSLPQLQASFLLYDEQFDARVLETQLRLWQQRAISFDIRVRQYWWQKRENSLYAERGRDAFSDTLVRASAAIQPLAPAPWLMIVAKGTLWHGEQEGLLFYTQPIAEVGLRLRF